MTNISLYPVHEINHGHRIKAFWVLSFSKQLSTFKVFSISLMDSQIMPIGLCKTFQKIQLWKVLTRRGLVMPYGDSDLGQHWLRCWFVAWWHQAITWTNLISISEVLWHLPESNFTASGQTTILYNEFESYIFTITTTSPRGQWVKEILDIILINVTRVSESFTESINVQECYFRGWLSLKSSIYDCQFHPWLTIPLWVWSYRHQFLCKSNSIHVPHSIKNIVVQSKQNVGCCIMFMYNQYNLFF